MRASRKTRTSEGRYIKSVVVVAVFVALAAAGGLLKMPSPVGSIALDSAPGFFVAGFFSPLLGGIVGAAGHLASAGVAGFPLAVAHILIAVLQFVWCYIFGVIVRKGRRYWALILASAVAVVLNGVAAPLILAALMPMFREMLTVLIPFLLLASGANVLLAAGAVALLARLEVPGL